MLVVGLNDMWFVGVYVVLFVGLCDMSFAGVYDVLFVGFYYMLFVGRIKFCLKDWMICCL